MKAIAKRSGDGYAHDVQVGGHLLRVDEPLSQGGTDTGAKPTEMLAASLASCVAITVEMYAARKGWELGALECQCEYEQPARGEPTTFLIELRISEPLTPEQVDRIRAVAGKCPVHRILAGEAHFEERITTPAPAAS